MDMDIQDQSKTTTPSGHICRRCGWPFPNAHPSSKHRRAHKRICGTIEGYTKLIDSEPVSDDEHDEEHSDEDNEKTQSLNIEKKIEEKAYKSEEDFFSDAVTEFSDGGFSTPGAEDRFFDTTKLLIDIPVDLKKSDDNLEVFVTPYTEDRYGSHVDKFTDDVAPSNTDNKDETEEAGYVVSVLDIPQVDNAETLLQDFKDHKNVENKYVVDTFEVKVMEEKILESQTCRNGEFAFSEPVKESGTVLSEEFNQEIVKEVESVIEGKEKIVEIVGVDSKDSGSSSRNSLEANWGSVSVLSTASIDENAHSISKSEISSDKIHLGTKSDAFEVPLLELKEETVDQKASEVNAVKVKAEDSQPPISEKRNEDAIAKVTNWSTTTGHIITTAPMKNLENETKSSSSPKHLNIQKDDEVVEKTSEVGKSNLVNQESSPPKFISEGKKVRKKGKGRVSWVPFGCCSSVNVS